MGKRFLGVLALLCALTLRPGTARADAPTPVAADAVVSTLAGSGLAGMLDGPAAQAQFLEPAGVSPGVAGDLYVADAAAQRIRHIDAAGRVTTVAGSGALDASGLFVPGGYRDGPAAQAQFDHPSGVALAPDGALLVADRLNHCVRRIAGGVVTTYAGKPAEPGNADGDLASARFNSPLGVAFDRAGNLYVADFHNGVRKIDRAGRVSTPVLPWGRGLQVTSVATTVEGGHDVLLIAMETGITRLDVTAGTASFYVAGSRPPGPFHDSPDDIALEGGTDLGMAYAAAPLGDGRFVYTDLRNHALRLVWDRQARRLTGSPDMYAAYNAGAFADGPGPQARFDAPLGIARIGADRFAVADAGNRRIRVLALHTPSPEAFEDLVAAKSFYRIVYVGNSFVDYQGDDRTSIAALVQASLRARATELGLPKPPLVFTVKLLADAASIGSYVRNYYPGVADLVIWQVNAGELSIPGGIGAETASRADVWGPVLQRELRATRAALAAEHTSLLAALNPMPWEVSPIEAAYARLYDLPVPAYESAVDDGEKLRAAFAAAGVPSVDLFPAFLASERAADRVASFSAYDHHFSESGRRLVAGEIVRTLAQLRPWAR